MVVGVRVEGTVMSKSREYHRPLGAEAFHFCGRFTGTQILKGKAASFQIVEVEMKATVSCLLIQ
jgi:hypothetical protein